MKIEPFYLELATRIRTYRMAAHMTQEALAATLGFGRASMVNVEQGRQRVLAHQLPILAEALGVDVRDLFPDRRIRISRSTAAQAAKVVEKEREERLRAELEHVARRFLSVRGRTKKTKP